MTANLLLLACFDMTELRVKNVFKVNQLSVMNKEEAPRGSGLLPQSACKPGRDRAVGD